ncbi:roadblock/LC7 domain-containing protein [Actinacidiphila glaucinigra]|uniref:roadblock/LC7 domain-containing protein n=1 Tax=Actinacidiphila glaucinigra TaxID=235986 RepID=UPI0029AD9D1B|nr:roadblock/LC7 domain-containing protein [Streptomyces sp. PA03-6a]
MNYDGTLDWMLDEALGMPETLHAVLLTRDGLLRAHSQGITRDEAERQAAALCGVVSISRNTAGFCGYAEDEASPPWRQTLIEFDDAFVLAIAAGEGSYLAVSASERVDLEACSFRMQQLVERLGKAMTSPSRQGAGNPA